jgi:hypothetical protein
MFERGTYVYELGIYEGWFAVEHHSSPRQCQFRLFKCQLMARITGQYPPFTKGGKLGLLKALRSYDDIFDTLLPRYRVWLK